MCNFHILSSEALMIMLLHLSVELKKLDSYLRNLHLLRNPDSYRTLVTWYYFLLVYQAHCITFWLYDIMTTQLNSWSTDNITVICSPLPLFKTLAGSPSFTYLVFLELFGKQTFLWSSQQIISSGLPLFSVTPAGV
jgi:hypothetical protein